MDEVINIFGDSHAVSDYAHRQGLRRHEFRTISYERDLDGLQGGKLLMVYFSGNYDFEQRILRAAADRGIVVDRVE